MISLRRICRTALIACFWIGVWWLAAWMLDQYLLFPPPTEVFKRLWQLLQTAEFYRITANSLWNILSGIVIAIFLGSLWSVLTSRFRLIREVTQPLMAVIKATPVASFIVLALIWIGASKVPTFTTILIVLPLIWTNLDIGFSKIDRQLIEVTKVFKMSTLHRYRYLILPSLRPYFVSACRAALGLAWKAGIAAEIIAMPRMTIGTMIGDAKQYIMTADMFAWTFTVIILSLLIEVAFSSLLDRFAKAPHDREVKAC